MSRNGELQNVFICIIPVPFSWGKGILGAVQILTDFYVSDYGEEKILDRSSKNSRFMV